MPLVHPVPVRFALPARIQEGGGGAKTSLLGAKINRRRARVSIAREQKLADCVGKRQIFSLACRHYPH